jgi:hypothetical protein
MELDLDEIKRLDKYQKNGFCPIDLGDRIAIRQPFTVLHKLGHGGLGAVTAKEEEGCAGDSPDLRQERVSVDWCGSGEHVEVD